MSDPFYTARASVVKVDGIHRRASLEDGTEIDFGVHGPIKSHYRLHAEPDRPLPVDYLVAADYSGRSTAHWRCAGSRWPTTRSAWRRRA